MFKSTWRVFIVPLSTAILALAAGCSTEKPAEQGWIFYPPPPDVPRLQFLTSFDNAEAWLTSHTSFSDFITGTTVATPTEIKNPYGMAARDGKIYICDLGFGRVHVIDFVKRAYGTLGNREIIVNPVNITIAPDGTKYVCDTSKRQVLVFDAQDQFVRALGNPEQCSASSLAVAADEMYVTDIANAKVEAWSRDGKVLRVIAHKGAGPDELQMPTNLAVGPNGHIYVADTAKSVVLEFDRDGHYLKTIGRPGDAPGDFARPKGVAIDPEGQMYVADAQWETVQVFNSQGRLLVFFGRASKKPDSMGMPAGVLITSDPGCMQAFARHVHPDFKVEYLLFVANQFGKKKIGVYAYGHPLRPIILPAAPAPASQPATRPFSGAAVGPFSQPASRATLPTTAPTAAPAP